MAADHNYFVYILTDKGRHTLYIGVTNDIRKRLYQHRNPEKASFTQRYHCTVLLHVEHYPDVHAAIAREKQLKGWVRRKKLALICAHNPNKQDLSADWL
jgi:putative endonuclease